MAAGVTFALVAVLIPSVSARADEIANTRAQAARLAAQIDSLGVQESSLSEQYDKAVLDEQNASQAVTLAEDQLRKAVADRQRAAGQLREFAVDSYVGGGSSALAQSAGGGLSTANAGLLRGEYISVLSSNRTDAVDRYRVASLQAKTTQEQLASVEQQAAARVQAVRTARTAVTQTQAQLQATYAQVKGQLATLVAQAQAAEEARRQQEAQAALARQRAAEQARLAALASVQRPSTPSSTPAPASAVSIPTGSGGAAAVAAAESRLGAPYVWGAAGPDSFDCSGLTMWAWAHAGVSLPHFSGAQYSSTTHIPMSDLQPGDLVFFSDPSEHVAMYIGNGQIIEAPHTGAVVHIAPLYAQFVLASRP